MRIKIKRLSILIVLAVLPFVLSYSHVFAKNATKGIHDQVNELLLEGNFAKAEKKAKKYLKKHPDEPEALCAVACVYRNQARKSAINVNTDAMGIKEGESGTYKIKGKSEFEELFREQVYYDRKGYKKAETLYYKIIEIDPSYKNAYFNLLNDYVTLEEFENYFAVIDLFITNLRQNSDTPHYLLDLAGKLFKGNYYKHTINLYNIILKSYPDFVQAKSDIGAVYSKQGRILEAKAIFREVYEKSPDDLINLKNYYFTCIITEDFNEAYKLVRTIINKEREEYSRYYDIALLAYVLDKDYKKYFKKYIAKRKQDVEDPKQDFWYRTAEEFIKIADESRESRMAFLHQILEQFHNAEYSDYVIIISNIIQKTELTSYALVLRCSVFDKHLFLEKTVECLNVIEKMKEKDPEIMSGYDLNWNYGRIHYAAEKYDIAKSYFLKNHESKKNDARVNHYLGMCYLLLGQKSKARKYFNMNKKIDDKSQMTYINYSIRELNKMGN